MPKKIRYKRPRRKTGNLIYKPRQRSTSVNVERAESILKGIFGTAVVVLLVFLGYSIGAPIYRYFSEKKNASSEIVQESEWTPTEEVPPQETVTSAPSVTEEKKSTVPPADNTAQPNIMAYTVSADAYKDPDSLRSELELIKDSGFNTALIVMKDRDGYFYYNTDSEYAKRSDSGNIRSDMTAKEIADMVKECGLTPAAEISLLADSAYYGADSGLSYTTENGGIWTDSSGKPWLSPYSSETSEYVSQITGELAEAGFDCIICTGIEFPVLEKSDYADIGEALAFRDRYSALVKIANAAYDAAAGYGAEAVVKVSADDIVNRKAEVFHPDELKCGRIAVLSGDSYIEHISKDDPVWGGKTVIPAYLGTDPDSALRTLIDNGFRECIIY